MEEYKEGLKEIKAIGIDTYVSTIQPLGYYFDPRNMVNVYGNID
jgi:hypothetical protein